jgi:hypothetical protein
MLDIINELFNNGFIVVFDTKKSDWVYKKGTIYHQLQVIDGICLLDYVYDENEEKKLLDENIQFENLKKHVLDLGLTLEFELGKIKNSI